jgi:methyl-accepting chemotaxis protein
VKRTRSTLARKVIVLAFASAFLPMLILSAFMLWELGQTRESVGTEVQGLFHESIRNIAQGVYDLCKTTDDLIQAQVDQSLKAARHAKKDMGEVALGTGTVTWTAVNQYTKKKAQVTIPKLTIGGTWLGQNADFKARTALIDDIVELVGGTATVFQRMNEDGDMLRIATNVDKDGKRAVGTYIPAVNPPPEAGPNPVVSTVLKGQTFRGRAYVVNAWYITAYEPLRNTAGKIVGMLYVGVKQENLESLRRMIMATKVGSDGYVYVLRGKDDVGTEASERGMYVISKDGKRDGEGLWDQKDADGKYFIRRLVRSAMLAEEGQTVIERYPWQNEGEPAPRMKFVAVKYYKPWDWVIGTGIYEDDLNAAARNVAGSLRGLVTGALVGGAVIALLAGLLAASMASRMTRPLAKVTEISEAVADGDLSRATASVQALEVGGQIPPLDAAGVGDGRRFRDETHQLLHTMQKMTANLNSLAGHVQRSGIQVTSSATQIAASARQLGATVSDQAASTNEVLATTTEITGTSRDLASVMQNVSEAVSRTADVADAGRNDLTQMAEAMRRLAESTGSISAKLAVINEKTENVNSVVTTIGKVADQTNLLSLNAGIEAEKAGEYGRGFSVVAREIRRLADQTAVATLDIEQMVNEMRHSVSDGVVEMDHFTGEVAQIVDEVSRIREQQEAIIRRQAMERLSEGAQQTEEALNEFKQTAGRLNEAARELQDEMARFKVSA